MPLRGSTPMRLSAFRLIVGFVAIPTPLVAQDLSRPTAWTGTLELAAGDRVAVEFRLEPVGDSLRVTMRVADGVPTAVTALRLTDDGVAFAWEGWSCALIREQQILDGGCEAADGARGELTLVAPEADRSASEQRQARNVLTTADLLRTQETNVYDAVRRLRPFWLRPRGQARIGYDPVVNVYLDGSRMGDATVLRSVFCNDVGEVRFYGASEATIRFGTNNEGGAIVLTRRRGTGGTR